VPHYLASYHTSLAALNKVRTGPDRPDRIADNVLTSFFSFPQPHGQDFRLKGNTSGSDDASQTSHSALNLSNASSGRDSGSGGGGGSGSGGGRHGDRERERERRRAPSSPLSVASNHDGINLVR